ncbi:hypothetical protein ACGVWS_09650 [Enterobacteriaceae bacterium LUAb1]
MIIFTQPVVCHFPCFIQGDEQVNIPYVCSIRSVQSGSTGGDNPCVMPHPSVRLTPDQGGSARCLQGQPTKYLI